GVPKYAGPPATITTYCLPSLPRYVIGTAWAEASIFSVHSSLPVRVSNARNRLSFVAPMKIRPLAVVMLPERFGAPVFLNPWASSDSVIPSGTFHAMSPVAAFTETSSPNGGFWHAMKVLGSQKPAEAPPQVG